MKSNTILKVAFFQPSLQKYSVPMFSKLSKEKGINLTIYYGHAPNLKNADPGKLTAFKTNPLRISLFGEIFIFDVSWLFQSLWGAYDVLVYNWDIHFVFLIPSLFLARLRGRRTLLWGHGYSKRERPWRKFLRYLVGHVGDGVIVYNKTTRIKLIRDGWKPKKVFAAPNALDQSDIQSARKYWLKRRSLLKLFQQRRGISPENTVLFCSRLEYLNRVDLLIQAHSGLLKRDSKAKLIIIGWGPEEENLKKMAKDLGISDSILFLGGIYDQKKLAPWFLSSGVYCYPRNIGLSILHAFGFGLPVITSDNLGIQNPEIEALKNGKNGFLYKDLNLKDLTDKLRGVLRNNNLRKKLSKEAHRTALEGYPLGVMVQGHKNAIFAANNLS